MRLLLGSGLLVLLVGSACNPQKWRWPIFTDESPDLSKSGRPECPDHVFIPDHKLMLPKPVVIPLVDAGTNIPEFNDCQALVDGAAYGPVVAIFARQAAFADTVKGRLYLLGVIFNFGTLKFTYVPYDPLSIKAGYSCLYAPLAGQITHAYLLHQDTVATCAGYIDSIPNSAGVLEARVRPLHQGDVVPKAARWEWDDTASRQYIGITCLNQWCEIGEKGFHSAPDPNTDWVASAPAPGNTLGQVHRVRAYFDVQQLAKRNAAWTATEPVVLSGARATFFPAPNLGDDLDYSDDQYVGTMIVSATEPAYKEKFGLTANQATHIFLKRRNFIAALFSFKKYRARFVTGDSDKTFKIRQRSHTGFPIPGMVRWRWLWDDETTWVKCLEGCCSTQ
jgi:hypothetical protein